MSNWNRIFKPIVVLCAICVVITGALAATNNVTAPIIEVATIAAQNAARTELLPEAEGAFSPVTGIEVDNVTDIYTADNGTGTVITCEGKGYGGTITVMVAFVDDTIKQIKITEQTETAGLGTKIENESFWGSFSGLAAQPFTISDINAISGATISSKAVTNAVNAAVEAYNQIP